jgi:hypothetical protein
MSTPFDEQDMAFVNSLTPDQGQALERLLDHVIASVRAGNKRLTPEQLKRPEDKCRYCDLPIAERSDGSWVHVGPNGETDRGCRAALFHLDEDAWLESTARTYAKPKRAGV